MAEGPIIVVGAGVGGLACAMLAAARGQRVLVLEKEREAGGKMRTLTVDGLGIDAGPTVLTMLPLIEQLFDECGTSLSSHLTLRPAHILARHAWSEREQLDLFADRRRSADAIGRFAGRAAANGYREFTEHARKVYEIMEPLFMRAQRPTPLGMARASGWRGLTSLTAAAPFTSLWELLGRYFSDLHLRQLYGRYATYCGSSPFVAPATLAVIAHVEQSGVWHVEGGMRALARALEGAARAAGAEFRFGAEVAEIRTTRGRASAVVLANGEVVPGRAVIANCDAGALAAGLLGADVRRAVGAGACEPRSFSAATWALVAKVDGLPLAHHTVCFARSTEQEFEDLVARKRPPADPTVYLCAQDRADEAVPSMAKERIFVIVNAPPDGGRSLSGREDIELCRTAMMNTLDRCGLRIAIEAEQFQAPCGLRGALPRDERRDLRDGVARLDGVVPPGGCTEPDPGSLSGGRERASGSRRADGDALGADGGGVPLGGHRFDLPVAPGGYAWWYLDALSDDGQAGLTLIAFVGSVFSPYYARARRRGAADPEDHVAINVALYGRRGSRWAMTERGRKALHRTAETFAVGPSRLTRRRDGSWLIDLDELAVPVPRRIRGQLRVWPRSLGRQTHAIHPSMRHVWQPLMPAADIEVALKHPASVWRGRAYIDHNCGSEPLEDAFHSWSWSRSSEADRTRIYYDTVPRGGAPGALLLEYVGDDPPRALAAPALQGLGRSFWGLAMTARSEIGSRPRRLERWEDGPFYARSLISQTLDGTPIRSVHEMVSLDRFRLPIVQAMLPFRMPRRSSA